MHENHLVFNLKDFLYTNDSGENALQNILSHFSCPLNPSVERFLKEQAVEFTKKNQSITYLVFSLDAELLGYFSIAIKPISINAHNFSNTVKRKMARVGEKEAGSDTFSLAAYLIAQLGKNYSLDQDKRISGDELLGIALEQIRSIQYNAGGLICFLEAENYDKLIHFYEHNAFKRFDTRHAKSSDEELIQLLTFL